MYIIAQGTSFELNMPFYTAGAVGDGSLGDGVVVQRGRFRQEAGSTSPSS
jgi:hypothetical protein